MSDETLVSELEQIKAEYARSQYQIAEMLEKLEHFHTQNAVIKRKLEQSQAQRQTAEANLSETQSRLAHVEGEVQQLQSQLQKAQNETKRLHNLQKIAAEAQSEIDEKYQTLIYEAWYAYQQGSLAEMVRYLQKSLRWSSSSRTKIVESWLNSLSQFAQESGESFNLHAVIFSQEWRGLIQTVMRGYRSQALS